MSVGITALGFENAPSGKPGGVFLCGVERSQASRVMLVFGTEMQVRQEPLSGGEPGSTI